MKYLLSLLLMVFHLLPDLSHTKDFSEPFNEYISRPAPDFKWRFTGQTFKTLLGAQVYILNVTTITWLDDSIYTVKGGSSLWTHEIAVIVPKQLVFTNVSTIYQASAFYRCNTDGPITGTTFDIELGDAIAADTRAITVVSFQTPNCPMTFKDDPEQMERKEDSLVAWSLREFVDKPDHLPERIIMFPMAKATLLQMRAAKQFITQNGLAGLESGWFVAGVSKRGWTTYLVGGASQTEFKILGITPCNPIIPTLITEMHHQYRAYGGFSFAFDDFTDAGLIPYLDTEVMALASKLADPLTFNKQLKEVPKMIVTASDDEFMMMEWSQYWYHQFAGEKHLLIVPNAEHLLVTNLPGAISAVTTFIKSIASGHTTEQRPQLNYKWINETGELSVSIPEQHRHKLKGVYLRHSETMSEIRRDFRYVRQENNHTEKCTLPWIKLPFGITVSDGNCIQAIIWKEQKLTEKAGEPGTYSALPPKPKNPKHWIGYYIEVYFEADTDYEFILLHNKFGWSTPGYVWPNTFPFKDCHGDCQSILV